MPGLLDNKGAAHFLGVTLQELKTLRLRRLVPVVRLGMRTLRYREADLAATVERMRQPAVWEARKK